MIDDNMLIERIEKFGEDKRKLAREEMFILKGLEAVMRDCISEDNLYTNPLINSDFSCDVFEIAIHYDMSISEIKDFCDRTGMNFVEKKKSGLSNKIVTFKKRL